MIDRDATARIGFESRRRKVQRIDIALTPHRV
jgi:hypothetical protein